MSFYDVVVVGAGPAGSTTARALAEKGFKVLVLEKKIFPRYKTCGGGITGRALKLLPDSIKESLEIHCTQVDMHVNALDWSKSFRRSQAIIAMTMRSQFDQALITAAQKVGALFKENCAFIDIEKEKEHYRIQTQEGPLFCRWIVAADGAQSSVAKKSGFNPIKKYWPALEWELYVKAEKLNQFKNRALFNLNYYPGGYAWIFPKSDHLSVGLCGPLSTNMQKALESFLIQENLTDYARVEKHGFMIPGEIRDGMHAQNGIFLVGDAAGFVDPILGEGIYFGLLSGKLAAESIVESTLHSKMCAEKLYSQKVNAEVIPALNSSQALSRILYLHPKIQSLIFKRIGKHLADRMIDVVTGEKNYPKISSGALGAAWIIAKRYIQGELLRREL